MNEDDAKEVKRLKIKRSYHAAQVAIIGAKMKYLQLDKDERKLFMKRLQEGIKEIGNEKDNF